jgi:N utilization substance protein A
MNAQPDETDVIRRLLDEFVPEIATGKVVIHGIAREPGARSLIAVEQNDPIEDPVGACVGLRGSRVKAMVEKLSGERIDIVRWPGSIEGFLQNLLAPIRPIQVVLDERFHRATIELPPDSNFPSSNSDRMRLMLASRLVGWELGLASVDDG